ncbi:MAG TPA: hypothetical protein VFU40_00690 [Gemmatimonadales bacterium]|nr:hypothetical protein [Gemmatimonadales bacterium]
MPAVRYGELTGAAGAGEASAVIRGRVEAARERQRARFRELPGVRTNAQMSARDIRRWCRLGPACDALLREGVTRLGLSARAYHRLLKLARTIADLAGGEAIREEHVSEAIQYRSLDRRSRPAAASQTVADMTIARRPYSARVECSPDLGPPDSGLS